MLTDHSHRPQCRTQWQRPDITHEHRRRVGIEPQKPETGSNDRCSQDREFPSPFNVGNQKILGKTNGNFNSGYIIGLQNAKPYVEVFTPTNMELVDGAGGASIPLFNY